MDIRTRKCLVYTSPGHICSRTAVALDALLGCTVCEKHRLAIPEELRSSSEESAPPWSGPPEKEAAGISFSAAFTTVNPAP
ncbi:MAG: hypothetical protein LC772_07630 [Chloroflexi bacterium]|nr:hypothetical protein [Chloroflexota bacterium]